MRHMTEAEFYYQMANLKEQDPDYIVDVLGITTEELISAFTLRAIEFIEKENT